LHGTTGGMLAAELGWILGLRDLHLGAELPASVLPDGAHDRRPPAGIGAVAVARARTASGDAKRALVEGDDLTMREFPRTVLHTIETGGPGGAERMFVHLATGLGPNYRSEAALIRDRWLGATLRGRGVPVSSLRYTSSRFAVTLHDLVKLIR